MWKPKSKSFDDPLTFEEVPTDHPAHLFYKYWRLLCGKRKFALKSDFDPAKVSALLPNIAITRLDYSAPEFDIFVTLVGERIRYLLSIEASGSYRHDYFSGDELEDRLYLYDHMAKEQLVKFFRMKAPFKGREFNKYIVGLFPFSSDGEKVDHFFLVIESI
ncbi:MAG: hypothetical protein COB49_06690 [Alphaproteobacteria bacterium]|nr:MAG: hypothetical protein COB49_06690 [Alphaproteobacteria bacterium]